MNSFLKHHHEPQLNHAVAVAPPQHPPQQLPRTPRKMGFSEGAARQPTVYVGFRAAYLQAQCLRGFPDYLPANTLLTRASGQAAAGRSAAAISAITTRTPYGNFSEPK